MQANALICDVKAPSAFCFGNRSNSTLLTLQRGTQYARLTLTRFTTSYFIFAIISCTVLSTHQVLTLKENGAAVSILSSFVSEDTAHGSIVLLENGVLGVCDGLPTEPGTNCTKIMTFGQNNLTSRNLWDDTSIVRPSTIFFFRGIALNGLLSSGLERPTLVIGRKTTNIHPLTYLSMRPFPRAGLVSFLSNGWTGCEFFWINT